MPMIRIFFVSLLCLLMNFPGHAQQVKKLTGISVWMKNGKVFADSTVAFIITYDKQGRTTSEWQLYRDTAGHITDTNYAEFDSMERAVSFYGNGYTLFYEYNSKGEKVKSTMIPPAGDTMHIYHLDPEMQNPSAGTYYTQLIYTHKGNTSTEEQADGSYKTTTVRDKHNRVVSVHSVFNIDGKRSVEEITYERDKKGRLITYTKSIMGKPVKRTTHYYKNGIEQSQLEEFFGDGYTITTTFTAEFWD